MYTCASFTEVYHYFGVEQKVGQPTKLERKPQPVKGKLYSTLRIYYG